MYKIAVIGVKGFPGFGGAARANENIIARLKDKYDYTVYAIESHTSKNFIPDGFKQIVFKSSKNDRVNVVLYYWKSMLHCLFKGKYDLIQINHYASGIIIPFLRLKYKVVATLRGIRGDGDEKFGIFANLYFKIAERAFFKFSNYLVSVSKVQIPYCRKFTNKKIVHIPNGINQEENISSLKIDQKKYLLFAAARILRIKGCHTFLQALRHIDYNGLVLVIGDLYQDPNYKKKILALSKGLNIDFISLIKNKPVLMAYLKNAKFFIFPSFIEGMSNILLEVASLKTPIICSNIASNLEIFDEDEVLYFEVGNPIDLAKKILWALNNEEKMKKFAKKAYQKLIKYYTWDVIAERYNSTYKKILKKALPSGSRIQKSL